MFLHFDFFLSRLVSITRQQLACTFECVCCFIIFGEHLQHKDISKITMRFDIFGQTE